ncbi:glycogen synthase [Candidatus Parcubacteria bacterium]|nr:MAG: glycogen synthase [Candidatus Parcubacteria bacterium]
MAKYSEKWYNNLMFKTKKKTKILFVAPEVAPFAQVGGLGSAIHSLTRALARLNYDVRVMMPRYATIDTSKFPMSSVYEALEVPNNGSGPIICNVKVHIPNIDDPTAPVITYFLENQEYYETRANVYGYADDAVRWAILSKGALEFIRFYKEWRPDVVVASDWQTGLIPNYLKTMYGNSKIMSDIATVFSIHNLSYQGMFDHRFVNEMDYDDGHSAVPEINNPRLLKINMMRRGIMYADAINTVSPTYAKEITTPDRGELLDSLLQEKRSRLFGILNGIDHMAKNPESDQNIEFKYNAKNLKERAKNKKVLREKFNLPEASDDIFTIGIVSRLSEQKGIDLLMETLPPLLDNFKFQLVVLGTGDAKYLSFFTELNKKYPNVATHLSFDSVLPSFVFAGADAVLIPSKFEPCGLTQMEAMRYGAIPIVRKTGGLADSVEDYDPIRQKGTGFVFEKFDNYSLYGAVVRAIEMHKHPKNWQALQRRAMLSDFSWDKSAKEYAKLFKKAIEFKKQGNGEQGIVM